MKIGWCKGLLVIGLVICSAGLLYAGESSGNPMTRTQTIQVLSERTGLTKLQVNAVFIELAKLSVEEAGRGVVVPELGKLTLVDRAARTGRNPATGAVIQIPASKKLKFKIAKSLSDAVMAKP